MDTPDHPLYPPPASMPPRRWLRAAAAVCGLLLAAASAGWWWSGSEGSLASSLRLASALLPAGQTLQTHGVQGSLRGGGRIGKAQWRQDGLALELQGLELDLSPALLLQGRLPLKHLHLEQLEGHELPSHTASPPLTTLVWPLQVDLSWQIDRVRWQAAVPAEATGLQGHYRFDGQQHSLRLQHLQWAQGQYQGHVTLQAHTPMALQARLEGQLQLPSAARAGDPLQAWADLHGALSGPQAKLTLQAKLSSPGQGPDAPALQLEGEIHPQATPWLSALQGRVQHIDLAALWPGAPHTRLNGSVVAQPAEDGWQLEVDLNNRLTGPWDQQRLPLQQLRARVRHPADGWQVPWLQARWPGGGVQGQGQWQAAQWQGNWQVDRLQPAQWLSWLQGPALSGQLAATHTGDQQLDMTLKLAPMPGEATPPASGLRAQVQWQQGSWRLPQLELHWAEARLQAHGQWTPASQRLQAQAQWQLPGLSGQLDGHISPHQGQGQWRLDSADLPRLQTWLQRWPALRAPVLPWPWPAALQASGQWEGGWTGEGLQSQALLASPGLRLQTQASLAMSETGGPWHGQITQLQIDGKPLPDATARLVLLSPLAWQWSPQQARMQWQPHRWSLLGEGHDAASFDVEQGHWHKAATSGTWPAVRLQGALRELPLQWARWLGWRVPPNDVVLEGAVDLRLDGQASVQARLERSRGDLQINADLPAMARVQAGLRTAQASLQVQGSQARLDLVWDSAQAGQLRAQLQSTLDLATHEGLAGLWPANAPLAGQLQAQLPRVGAWAWLAPPGWRVQGSLDASVQLAGTRSQPQWNGTLQGDDLSVRSAVEGIEFRQGHLRARLQEQQIQLEAFRLRGAGAQGGELSAQGLVRWLPQDNPALQALQSVQMDLQMQARGLRVTNRADRRLSVSGQVRTRLDRGQMQLRGELQADSALFILPDDNTPTLGKDVRVQRAAEPTPATPLAPPAKLSVMGTPDVEVLLQLGPDFQLRGQGLSTRLAGQVRLSSNAATSGQPRLAGQVNTEGGRYKAYGQQLDIDQGLLVFSGAYDNPALDILALRPNLGQRVGVRVTGSAMTPRVRLYADPDMPDADKLAWLVLGRSPAAGGAESAVLQQAALALLGGNGKSLGGELAGALGFDEVSLASRTSTSTTGLTATGTAVTLGKRLSKDFYLAYESSVSGAFGSLFIFYDLSRKLALRAQTGETNALDLIWSIRHD